MAMAAGANLAARRPSSPISPDSLHVNVLITNSIIVACTGLTTFNLVTGPFTPDLAEMRNQVLAVGNMFEWAEVPRRRMAARLCIRVNPGTLAPANLSQRGPELTGPLQKPPPEPIWWTIHSGGSAGRHQRPGFPRPGHHRERRRD